jgi:hypothetical protein
MSVIHRTQFNINNVETGLCPCHRFCFQSTFLKHSSLYTLLVLSKLDSEETTRAATHIFLHAMQNRSHSK